MLMDCGVFPIPSILTSPVSGASPYLFSCRPTEQVSAVGLAGALRVPTVSWPSLAQSSRLLAVRPLVVPPILWFCHPERRTLSCPHSPLQLCRRFFLSASFTTLLDTP